MNMILTWVCTSVEVGVKWLAVWSRPTTLGRSGNQTDIHTHTKYTHTYATICKQMLANYGTLQITLYTR